MRRRAVAGRASGHPSACAVGQATCWQQALQDLSQDIAAHRIAYHLAQLPVGGARMWQAPQVVARQPLQSQALGQIHAPPEEGQEEARPTTRALCTATCPS